MNEQENKANAFDIIKDNVDLILRQGRFVVKELKINDVGYYLEIRCAYEVITTDLSKEEYEILKQAGVREE